MAHDRATLALPDRAILAPIAWVIESGWLPSGAEVVEVGGDAEAAAALADGSAGIALVDPVYWAGRRRELRVVPRSCVGLGHEGGDMLLLSEVRLDGLEKVTVPPSIRGTSAEAVARTLVREYYGVESPLELSEDGAVGGGEGRIVEGADAMRPQSRPYVEDLARAWWVMTGTPWLRALPVERSGAPADSGAEALLREVGVLLAREAETVAAGVARARGGSEDRWLGVVRALSLSYGGEERKGLSALLGAASRLRLCPRVEDVALPRY